MITKIDYIKKFGIYKNFNWSNLSYLPDFKYKNIIYGWNYSGKTTLSRIFSSLEKKDIFASYQKGDFKISTTDKNVYTKNNLEDFPFKILVFNSDYIKENLRWEIDDDINAIFFEVGDGAKASKEIERLENEIIKIVGNEKIKGKKEKFISDVDNFKIFEDNLFTEESRRIKNEVFSSLIEFNKGHLKKQLGLVIQNIDSFILDKEEIKRLNKIVKVEKPKPEVNLIEFDFQISSIINETNKLLISEPQKKDVIQILDNNVEALKWVEKGLTLNKVSENCLFCNNEIKENRIELLNKYYQNEAAKIRKESLPLLEKLSLESHKIKTLNFPNSVQDINEGFQELYIKNKKDIDIEIVKYLKKLKEIENSLEAKIKKNIYSKSAIIPSYKKEVLENKLKELNDLLTKNKNFFKNFPELITSERHKYINHLTAKFLKENKYLAKELKHDKAFKEIERLDKKVNEFNIEMERLKALKNSAEEGGQQFNYFIKSFLGKDDIEIKFNEKLKKYNLYRGSEIAKHLSEGEKMAISFSHFLVTLKSLEQKDTLKQTILFIDDPISSLDGNHIFQINALLKDFLYEKIIDPDNSRQKKWNQKCLQLFVSTHNYEFFNLLKELPTTSGFGYSKKNNKKESRYFISRKINDSEIINLPKVYDDFQSEYHYLFKQIHQFSIDSSSDKIVIMPNILRRFLEIYTLAKYPSKEEVDERATVIWNSQISKRICKPFHFFSHFNNIDRIGKHSELLADVSQACNELIKQLKKDETHYKALETII